MAFVNTFVAWSNYIVLGCPRSGGAGYEPRVDYRGVQDARAFADRLLGEVEEFASGDLIFGSLLCDGKRAAVERAMNEIPDAAGAKYSASSRASRP